MSLIINSPEANKLANQLANETGEDVAEAVIKALRERVDRVRNECGPALADRLVRIGGECAAHLKEPFRSVDHGDLLYSDQRLPRR